jgi:cyanate lyase
MKKEYEDFELKALILDWLHRRGRWGSHYFSIDSLVNRLSHVVKNDGKKIKKIIKELIGDGYLLAHKKGEVISLNPTKSREIIEYIKNSFKI